MDHHDRKLCSVRAIKAYMGRTKELKILRGHSCLFLNTKKSGSDISPHAHLSMQEKVSVTCSLSSQTILRARTVLLFVSCAGLSVQACFSGSLM